MSVLCNGYRGKVLTGRSKVKAPGGGLHGGEHPVTKDPGANCCCFHKNMSAFCLAALRTGEKNHIVAGINELVQ